MNRIPRKKKKQIPRGRYCYTFLEFLPDGLGYKIKPCSFYKHVDGIDGICTLEKKNHDIEDQCKSCGIKLEYK